MARPERKNADYFPFYAKDGRTLFLLESKYQCKGTGFFTNVMRFLTLETNHHVNIGDETDGMYFFSKCHCDEESGMDMLNIMAKTGKINKGLWALRVVASQDLLDSLVDAYRNRKNDIISMDDITKKYVPDVGNKVSGVGNPQGPGVPNVENPQRKRKEKKQKETKIRFLDHVDLKKKEFETLKEKYGQERADRAIEILNDYFVANIKRLKKYTSHYGAINSWVMEKVLEKMPKQGESKTNLIGKTICRECKKPPGNGYLQDGVCEKCRGGVKL